jgi:glucose-6-phosphate-specific signal transduction histidine kinase
MTIADRTVDAETYQDCCWRLAKERYQPEVHILLNFSGQRIGLQITDNGCGFDPVAARKSGGFGLTGMRERILALGGTKSLTSRPGAGATINIDIPTTGKTND